MSKNELMVDLKCVTTIYLSHHFPWDKLYIHILLNKVDYFIHLSVIKMNMMSHGTIFNPHHNSSNNSHLCKDVCLLNLSLYLSEWCIQVPPSRQKQASIHNKLLMHYWIYYTTLNSYNLPIILFKSIIVIFLKRLCTTATSSLKQIKWDQPHLNSVSKAMVINNLLSKTSLPSIPNYRPMSENTLCDENTVEVVSYIHKNCSCTSIAIASMPSVYFAHPQSRAGR